MGTGGQGIRFGKKTGATLRRPRGGSNHKVMPGRIYKIEEHVQTSYGVISNEFSCQFDDGKLCTSSNLGRVQYSLNKRKRWSLPDFLKENIETDTRHTANSFQVRLIECQAGSSSTQANCIGMCSSKGEKRNRKPRKTFSQTQSLLDDCNTAGDFRKKRKKRSREIEVVDPIPEIQYTVLYTPPSDSFKHFNSQKSNKSKVKKKKRSKHVTDEFLDISDALWDDEEEYQMKNSENHSLLPPKNLGHFIPNSLSNYKKSKKVSKMENNSNSECNEESKLVCPNRGTGCFNIYFGKDATIFTQEEKNPLHWRRLVYQRNKKRGNKKKKKSTVEEEDGKDPLDTCINICKKSSTPESLYDQFGNNYKSGESLPKKFSINISVFIDDLLTNSGNYNLVRKIKFYGQRFYVLFFNDDADENENKEFTRMRMSLFGIVNRNSCIYFDAFEPSLSNSRVYTVHEVIQTIQRLFTVLPPKLNVESFNLSLPVKPSVPLKALKSALNVQVDIMAPRLAVKEKKIEGTQFTVKTTGMSTFHTECGICDDGILPSRNRAMALCQCQHWFCNECWKLHAESRIQRGDPIIVCPGYECNAPVDDLSLMSILSADKFFAHKTHAQNRYIDSKPDWYWCPRPHCGRVALVKGNANGNSFLSCECGLQSCLECKEEVHWPATCHQFQEYQSKMTDKRNQEKDLIRYVQVKRCPVCFQPMEKNRGCNVMTCRCGQRFCWRCLSTKGYGCDCDSYRTFGKRFEYIKLKQNTSGVVYVDHLLQKAFNHHLSIKGVKKRREFKLMANSLVRKMFLKKSKEISSDKDELLMTQRSLSSYEQVYESHLKTLTEDVLQLFFESKKILECSNVLLSFSQHDLNQGVGFQVSKLEHIAQTIEEILKGDCRFYNTYDGTEKILNTLLVNGNNCLKLLVNLLSQKPSNQV